MLLQVVAVVLTVVLVCALCALLSRLYAALRLGASPLTVGAVAVVALAGFLAVMVVALGHGGPSAPGGPSQQPPPTPAAQQAPGVQGR